ncbi:MAG: pantoate--beta-alanine ligase [Oligoflexia bacterium]|nr:pantoate--beta-alanine ligase [Oligoflexia bacterium]
MQILKSEAELKRALENKKTSLGFVPTMGALHQGHLSLVEKAQQSTDQVIVSIFVNPLQFGPKEDFQKYPRVLEKDFALLEKQKTDFVFVPRVEDVYPQGWKTKINVHDLANVLCGKFRPGHFEGVCTVVARFFQLIEPSHAYFGLKDLQQFLVLQQMARDLFPRLKVIGCETFREVEGLAMSSRNQYLDAKQKEESLAIFRGLNKAEQIYKQGTLDSSELIKVFLQEIEKVQSIEVQYAEIRELENLELIEQVNLPSALFFAGFLGSTRLIDNRILHASEKLL